MGIDHHVTLPYCPWENGSVEVVGKDLLFTCRDLCSELQVAVDEWDAVLPLAEYAINPVSYTHLTLPTICSV